MLNKLKKMKQGASLIFEPEVNEESQAVTIYRPVKWISLPFFFLWRYSPNLGLGLPQ
jgi:hypothetical protein